MERYALAGRSASIARACGVSSLAPVNSLTARPLSLAQQWWAREAASPQPISITLSLREKVNRTALQAALDRIVTRHEILRTTFCNVEGQLAAFVAAMDVGFSLSESVASGGERAAQDQSSQPAGDQERALEKFDLSKGPLIRGRLFRTEGSRTLLQITAHRAVFDTASARIFARELQVLYDAFDGGKPDPLPPLPLQYTEYANRQLQLLSAQELAHQFELSKQSLATTETLQLPTRRIEFSTQDTRCPSSLRRIDRIARTLPASLSARLHAMAADLGVSRGIVLLASWAALLGRWAGVDEVVICARIPNRPMPELKALIGPLENTVPIRIRGITESTIEQLMRATHTALVEASQHTDLPFERVLDTLSSEAAFNGVSTLFADEEDLLGVPVAANLAGRSSDVINSSALEEGSSAQSNVITQSSSKSLLEAANKVGKDALQASSILATSVDANADTLTPASFFLRVKDAETSVTYTLEYLTERFDRDTVERLVTSWEALLTGCAANCKQTLHHLPILSPAERHRVVEEFNATDALYPREKLVHELFEEQVTRTPQATAAVYEGQSLTYTELNSKANHLAHHLRYLGIGPDQLVALCIDRSVDMLVALLGILKAGGAYVPLDPSYPAERLQYMLEDAAPRVILTQSHLQQRVSGAQTPVIAIDTSWSEISEQPPSNLDPAAIGVRPDHLAYMIYTSGSTGRPKGVLIEHRNVLNLWTGLEALYPPVTLCQRVALNASLNFDASVQQYVQLLSGRTVFIVPQEIRQDATRLLAFLETNHLDAIDCTPSQLRAWFAAGLGPSYPRGLKTVLVGGEAIDPELWNRMSQLSTIAFFNVYGPTECTVDSTSAHITMGPVDLAATDAKPTAKDGEPAAAPHIGRPMLNRRIYILDRFRQPVPIGVAGEIHIGGAGVGRGYHRRPELTAERFLDDPFSTSKESLNGANSTASPQRMYRTGDLGRWRPDGTVEYLGRNDEQVKIRGFRIELGEIEAQLRRDPRVKEAAVLAREDAPGEKRLVAYVIPTPSRATTDAVKDERIQPVIVGPNVTESPGEPYPAGVSDPAGVSYPVTMVGNAADGDLPTINTACPQGNFGAPQRNLTGPQGNLSAETLRSALKSALPDYMIPAAFVLLERFPLTPSGKLDRRALPPPDEAAYARRTYEPPQGTAEERLSQIWQDLLRIPRVGRQDDFFELGGHSLLIVQMKERLRRAGWSIAVRSVYDNPTLAGIASRLQPIQQSDPNSTHSDLSASRIPLHSQTITPEMLPLVDLTPEQIQRIVSTVPGGAANIQDIYPLAPLQEGILFHHLLSAQHGDTYVLPLLLSGPSPETLQSLIQALQQVINRHDILRTAVLWEQLPRPLQVVYRQASLPVEEISLGDISLGEISLDPQGDLLQPLHERLRPEHQHLNLRQAPLMRLQFARSALAPPNRWYAILQVHHLVCDNGSLQILLSEIHACMQGRAGSLPEPVPYRNHVAEALKYAQQQDATPFFRAKLGDIEDPIAPFDLQDVHGNASHSALATQRLEPTLSSRLRTQARRHSVSAATLFHAAWALVVSRTTARDDVVYGTVLLGRLQGDAGGQLTLGMFINTLPLRLRLAGETAQGLLQQTHRELVELLSHEQCSLADAQRCSGIAGSAPLFTALLNYRHSTTDQQDTLETDALQLLGGGGGTNYPVTLSVDDQGVAFELTAQTDHRIDPQRIIGYLETALGSLVEALEKAPNTAATSLPVLPASERHQVIEDFNATDAPYPKEKLVHELFEAQVRRTPTATAVVDGEHSLTYAALNAKANQLAQYLRLKGVQAGEYIPLLMARGTQLIIAQLAVLKCGGAYVPVDPSFPAERQHFMIRDCDARRVLIEPGLQLPPNPNGTSNDKTVQWIDLAKAAEAIDLLPATNPAVPTTALSPMYVMYTSGSTGTPKGVIVPHRAVNRLIINNGYAQLEPTDAVAHNSNTAFDAATFEIWGALLNGARIVIVPQEILLDSRRLAELLQGQRVTVLWMTIGLLAQYAQALGAVFGQLRYLLTGGDVIDPTLMAAISRKGPPTNLLAAYGPTECTTFTSIYPVDNRDETATSIPLGRPIANTRLYVLDPHLEPVPIGVKGEIYIGGDGVALGYLNRPELTNERFVPDRLTHETSSPTPEQRLYKTGDLGRWRPDGNLEFLGRNDQQIKLRGFRVELGEIETHLMRHEQVKDAAVVARADGPGEKRLVAYVTPRTADAPAADELRARLATSLPAYMIPSAFVVLEKLPLTATGKWDRRALPAPEPGAFVNRSYRPPQGPVERLLAELWQRLLSVERVGRDDNFFELGGHSLYAIKLIGGIAEHFAVDLPVPLIFQAPTVREMAERVQSLLTTRTHEAEADFEEGVL